MCGGVFIMECFPLHPYIQCTYTMCGGLFILSAHPPPLYVMLLYCVHYWSLFIKTYASYIVGK